MELNVGDVIVLDNGKEIKYKEETHAYVDNSGTLMVYTSFYYGNYCGYAYRPFGHVKEIRKNKEEK